MTTTTATTVATTARPLDTVLGGGRLPLRYVLLETKRQLRNVRAMVFTFAVPVVMLLVFGAAYGSQQDPTTHLQYLVVTTLQMASYGAMMAALSQAFAIVNERSIGWNRQLRVTPLSGWGFLVSKVIAAMAFAAVSIVVTRAGRRARAPRLARRRALGRGRVRHLVRCRALRAHRDPDRPVREALVRPAPVRGRVHGSGDPRRAVGAAVGHAGVDGATSRTCCRPTGSTASGRWVPAPPGRAACSSPRWC